MTRLSPQAVDKCRTLEAMHAACPGQVPTTGEEIGQRASFHRIGRGDEAAYLFEAEWGAPYGNRVNERDAPPRYSHLVVMAGDVGSLLRFKPARSLGKRSWGGRDGELALAPPYPHGGVNGSHLVLRWEEGGHDYAVSLHAWEPLAEAEAALRETVLSIP
jgi:hypothetical protein